jgi:hypothetical protein
MGGVAWSLNYPVPIVETLEQPIVETLEQSKEALLERYYRRAFNRRTGVSISDAVDKLGQPQTRSVPLWADNVLVRIASSIEPSGLRETAPGRYISSKIASAASAFFEAHASVLPSEPYIYASEDGDLVAEFEARAGSLTAIIGDKNLVLFAKRGNGKPHYWQTNDPKMPEARAVEIFSRLIGAVNNGSVAAAR